VPPFSLYLPRDSLYLAFSLSHSFSLTQFSLLRTHEINTHPTLYMHKYKYICVLFLPIYIHIYKTVTLSFSHTLGPLRTPTEYTQRADTHTHTHTHTHTQTRTHTHIRTHTHTNTHTHTHTHTYTHTCTHTHTNTYTLNSDRHEGTSWNRCNNTEHNHFSCAILKKRKGAHT
jgi:hypothetical protein